MIYTVTFNPAIDYIIGVRSLEQGMTNRAAYERILPGGKGLNVSMLLCSLGMESTALGFIAGFTGAEIKRRFEEFGGKSEFIELEEGNSRINVKIKSDVETEINASGPIIDDNALSELMSRLNQLKDKDILILAGSIPQSLPASIYMDIMKMLSGRNIIIAVDASGELLLNVLPYRPFLIKPNNHELGEIFNVEIKTREEAVPYAKKLQEKGAVNVLVSMAGEGAVLVTDTAGVMMGRSPKGIVRNSVGAGDSMVAGFIAGRCQRADYAHAFKMGIAAGSACAFSEMYPSKSEIEKIYNTVEIL